MDNKGLICLFLALFVIQGSCQWTSVISQEFTSPDPDYRFTFLAGHDYQVNINRFFSTLNIVPSGAPLGLFDFYSGSAAINAIAFTPTVDTTVAFVPNLVFISPALSVTLDIIDVTVPGSPVTVITITRDRSLFQRITVDFEGEQFDSYRIFVKRPILQGTVFRVALCTYPAQFSVQFPCFFSSLLAFQIDQPTTYITGILPETGRYVLTLIAITDFNPIYLTAELSKCYNSRLDIGEQCDLGEDSLACSHCISGYGYTCSGQLGGPSICTEICGNSIKSELEQCDNGNQTGCVNCVIAPGYGCTTNNEGSSICTIIPGCGNGIVEASLGEECDNRGGVGCSAACKILQGFKCSGNPSVCSNCGNNVVEGLEQCDGSANCGANCTFFTCNNGIWETGENCDNGGTNGDGCSNTCFVQPEYTCDGFINSGLPSSCVPLYQCGNAIFEPFNNVVEQCDNGNGPGCSQNCRTDFGWKCFSFIGFPSFCERINTSGCGNGVLDNYEVCDDGNILNGDGCSNFCTVETNWICPLFYLCFSTVGQQCGNGYPQPSLGESCDDGNNINGDGCSATCVEQLGYTCYTDTQYLASICTTKCGNGYYRPDEGENCDDGNILNGDGCSSTCTIENGFYCPFNEINRRSGCERLIYGPICGDGYVEGNQQCDDGFFIGNNSDTDGCDKNCKIVFGWNCDSSSIGIRRGISYCWRIGTRP